MIANVVGEKSRELRSHNSTSVERTVGVWPASVVPPSKGRHRSGRHRSGHRTAPRTSPHDLNLLLHVV